MSSETKSNPWPKVIDGPWCETYWGQNQIPSYVAHTSLESVASFVFFVPVLCCKGNALSLQNSWRPLWELTQFLTGDSQTFFPTTFLRRLRKNMAAISFENVLWFQKKSLHSPGGHTDISKTSSVICKQEPLSLLLEPGDDLHQENITRTKCGRDKDLRWTFGLNEWRCFWAEAGPQFHVHRVHSDIYVLSVYVCASYSC